MTQNNGGSFLDKMGAKVSDMLDRDKTTGQMNAENTQHAFSDDVVGLGSLLSGSGLAKELGTKLQGLTSLDQDQMQEILGALGQSQDTNVQAAQKDLAASQHDAPTFAAKLKGYAASLSQVLPLIQPVLKKIFGAKA